MILTADFLGNITMCSLCIIGLKNAMNEGELLHFVRWLIYDVWVEIIQQATGEGVLSKSSSCRLLQAMEFVFKPICLCVKCMASVWGIAYLWFIGGFDWDQATLIFILAVSGLNTILSELID